MNHKVINKLISFWKQELFTEPVVILLFAFCLVVGLFFHHKERERIAFLFYFIIGLSLFVGMTIIEAFKILSGRKYWVTLEFGNTFFELVEFAAFYLFFNECLKNKMFKKISAAFLITLVIICISFFIGLTLPRYRSHDLMWHSLIINVIEFLFLFIMCLAYFYKLFTDSPRINLLRRPSFYIATSTFFYAALPIPFFVLANDIFRCGESVYFLLFDCHYLLLAVVLFFLSKAFLCKIPITT